ncbi:MAG TPA: hypothetical protein VNP89_12780 [Gaiellaceae bacterium]|nr:hypothetical protein [Gaiellaceae bacterium]
MKKPPQICHTCRRLVDPSDPDVILAARQVDVTAMGRAVSRQYADGIEQYFHRRHMPGGRSYREVAPASD